MVRKGLEYRHLEVFRAIMRSGTATGAGSLLGVTQPAISRLLGQAEKLAGFSLFTRVRGRLVPTPEAEQLYAETERIFVGVQEIATLCERLQRGTPRRVLIASLPVLTLSLLPLVALEWRRMGRQETLSIHSRTAGSVLGLVASRQVDLALGLEFSRVPGVRSAPLARARFYCAMAADHRLAACQTIRAEQLDGEPFVALSREERSQEMIDAVFRSARVSPREIVECRLVSAAATMAAVGVGITLVDAFSAAPFLGHRLLLRPFEPAIALEYRLMWPENDGDPPLRSELVKAVRSQTRSLMQSIRSHVARS